MIETKHKIAIFTRDGKSYNDFLENHNLTKENSKLIRTVSELNNFRNIIGYVIIPPTPLGYNKYIKPLLTNYKNLTKKYNKSI